MSKKGMESVEEHAYRTPELAAIIGHTLNKVNAYINSGYIKPSIQEADGYSSRRLWSYSDVVRACLIRVLEDWGLKPKALRELGEDMTDERVMENRIVVIHDLGVDQDIVVWNVTIEGKPLIPPDLQLSHLNFDEKSPVKLVISMVHIHELVRKRIAQKD